MFSLLKKNESKYFTTCSPGNVPVLQRTCRPPHGSCPCMNFDIFMYCKVAVALNWIRNSLYNMHRSCIYIYMNIWIYLCLLCTCFANTCIRIPEDGCMCTHTQTYIRIHRPTHRHRVTTKKWFQWKRIMKHHLHLETLKWMKAITQTCAANHQKHDPQITKQVCKSVSKNASVEHHTTSSPGGFKKKKSLRNLGKMNPFLTNIFFKWVETSN